MTRFGGVSAEQLRQYIERIERLEEEKKALADHTKDVFSEAKANGYDVKAMRQIIKLRKMDQSDREEEEYVLDTYKAALGMIPDFERDDSSAEQATEVQPARVEEEVAA